jgi:uncharacterized protein
MHPMTSALLCTIVLAGAVTPAIATPEAGRASGRLTIGEATMPLRHAWVIERDTLLRIILSSSPLDETMLLDSDALLAAVRRSGGGALVIRLDEMRKAEEVFFFHPDLFGVSVREVARFTPQTSTGADLGGRIIMDDPGFSFSFDATFEAPINRIVRQIQPLPENATPAEHARWRLLQLDIDPAKVPLSDAVFRNDLDLLNLLLAVGEDDAVTGALVNAVSRNRPAMVKPLVEHGADVNYQGIFDRSLLFVAADEGASELVAALLAAGADPDVADGNGTAPLAAAASGGYLEAVTMLIAAGATLDARSTYGSTALWVAVTSANRPIVQALLDAGADVHRDLDELLESAVGHPDIVAMLKEAASE